MAGTLGSPSSWLRKNAQPQTRKPIPASNTTMLTIDQTMFSAVGWLSIKGSWGQLLVKVASWPSRSVAAAQAVQKKKYVNCWRRAASGKVFSFMAKLSRLPCSEASLPNSAW
ncbi:hypothetical protein D3C71_1926660 [compost metagenome]